MSQAAKDRSTTSIVVVVAVVLGIQTSLGLAVYFLFPSWPTRGAFGDMFGAANALFSGLAFAGVIITILLQRQELSLQREELAMTRKELARTADAQAAQSRVQLQQYLGQYARNLLAASQMLDEMLMTSPSVEEHIHQGSAPRTQQVITRFMGQFQDFLRSYYGSIAWALGPRSLEINGLLQLQGIIWTAQKTNEWVDIDSFFEKQESLTALLERVQRRAMFAMDQELDSFGMAWETPPE